MHDPRSALLQHNSGRWAGCFIRLNPEGRELERFPTQLDVRDTDGVVESRLTYLNSGQERTMAFRELPFTMQVSPTGDWSLGPSAITPWSWVGELCVVRNGERRRAIVRHGVKGLDGLVYVVETLDASAPALNEPLCSRIETSGTFTLWHPEPGVELLLDTRARQSGDATACGIRWRHPGGDVLQVVRRYDEGGQLLPLETTWP